MEIRPIREAVLAPGGETDDSRLPLNHSIEIEGGVIHRMTGSRTGERCDGELDLPGLIRSVYLSELGRLEEPPLADHLEHWAPKLAGLGPDEARAKAVEEVKQSTEHTGREGAVPLEKLLESVYWSELGRPSDAEGHANWLGHAQARRGEGWTNDQIRTWLVEHFRNSQEYQKRITGGVPTDWGDVYWCHNARLNEQLQVRKGFAITYEDRRRFPETNGRPPYELLGPPTKEEEEESPGRWVQAFERGRMTWSAAEDVRLELDRSEIDRFEAPKVRERRKFALTEPRRVKETALSELQDGLRTPQKPRVRVAPSPSGHLHPGNLWMALANFRLAKQIGADFLLRIEDTDPARSRIEYVEAAKEALRWAGIQWKEDEVEFQSRRGEIYRQAAEKLIASGHAYRKDGAVWFRMPETEAMFIEDRAKGRVRVKLLDDDGMRDFPILRADRTATFLLANTVDDAEQKVTHVVRGEDHLLNAARQICIYRALGHPVPEFFHVPHILGDEGAEKLSKRNGATSVLALKEAGIAPEVLVNHLARLGTKTDKDDRIKTLDELGKSFDRFGFSKTPTRIGLDDLYERNRKFIAGLDRIELRKRLEAFDPELMRSLSPVAALALVEAAQGRASTFREAIEIGRFTLEAPKYGEKSAQKWATSGARDKIALLENELRHMRSWSLGDLRGILAEFNARHGVKFVEYASALQWMLTGAPEGLPIENTLALLGREESLARISRVLSNAITLLPERDLPPPPVQAKTSKARAPRKTETPIGLKGATLQCYLSYAKQLGSPLGEPYRDASGLLCQRFTKAVVNEHGQVQFDGRPSWIGSPFLVVHHLDGKGTHWLGGAPHTEAEGLRPTGNNHFTRDLGSVGEGPWDVRAIRFKLFLKQKEAALVFQSHMENWNHRWGFDGRADVTAPSFPWPRCSDTKNLPVGEWIDVRLDLMRDLLGAAGTKLKGLAFSGDDGNVLYTDVRLESGGQGALLASYMKHRAVLGEAVGEASMSEWTGEWQQEFEHGWVRQDGQIYFRDHQHWLTGGKLDAWLEAPLALGAPVNEAYQDERGIWQQDFEHGTTNDLGWVKFKGHDYWMAGSILDAYVAHARKLGKPTAPARSDGGGLWTQTFENGWASTDGRFGIGEKAPPALSELSKLADDALVAELGTAPIYIIRGGAKFHIPDPPTFDRMGFDWNKVVQVEPGVLDHLLEVPRDGTLLREENATEIFEMRGGMRCPASNPRGEAVIVPDHSLASIPMGEPI